MNILIVAQHYAVCSARYAADAFERMGHSVRHVGQPMGRYIWGMQVPEQYVWTPDADFSNWISDLTIVMDSDPAILDYADMSTAMGNEPTVVWGVDNHVRDYRRPDFDHYFLAHKSVSVMPWVEFNLPLKSVSGIAVGAIQMGYDDMTWLPCAADSACFQPSLIPYEQRKWDVACLGVLYPQRHALVEAMKRAGLKVIAGTGLVYENYAAVYQDARVSLCVSACGDLAIRVFETARVGCAVLSDPIADLAQFVNNPIVQYHSIEEAVELARSLQNSPQTAEACADWASNETWEQRAQVVIDWLEARQ